MKRASTFGEWHKLYGRLLGPLLIACGVSYLIFHVLIGEHGVYALLKENRRLELLNEELATVSAERKDMEHHVRLMSAGSLDRDLLDEQSRIMLNDGREDEVVIPLNPPTARPVELPAR